MKLLQYKCELTHTWSDLSETSDLGSSISDISGRQHFYSHVNIQIKKKQRQKNCILVQNSLAFCSEITQKDHW